VIKDRVNCHRKPERLNTKIYRDSPDFI
jgi:hypothetical protein